MTPRSRARWSLAGAVVLHGWVLFIAPRLARHRPPGPVVLAPPSSELEIAVEAPPPSEPSPVTAPAPAEPTSLPAVAVARSTLHGPEAARPSSSDASEPGPVASAEPGSNAAWSFSPTGSAPAPASSGSAEPFARATAAGVAAVVADAEKRAADRASHPKIFTPQDLALGLVPGSQYVAIVRDRVRNSLTPMNGHALLEFWTDKRGIVARVRVLSASADAQAWNNVAGELVEDARSSFPLKIPSNADGIIVTLDVSSALKTLSGKSPNQSALGRIVGAVTDPVDAVMDAKAAPQRVVAARVVSVETF